MYKTIFRNQLGFSLIQGMLLASAVAGMALVGTKIISNQKMVQKSAEAKDNVEQLHSMIYGILQNKDHCTATLLNVNSTLGATSAVNSINTMGGSPNGVFRINTNDGTVNYDSSLIYMNNSVTINKMNVTLPSSMNQLGSLDITYGKLDQGEQSSRTGAGFGGKEVKKTISLKIQRDQNNNFESCYAVVETENNDSVKNFCEKLAPDFLKWDENLQKCVIRDDLTCGEGLIFVGMDANGYKICNKIQDYAPQFSNFIDDISLNACDPKTSSQVGFVVVGDKVQVQCTSGLCSTSCDCPNSFDVCEKGACVDRSKAGSCIDGTLARGDQSCQWICQGGMWACSVEAKACPISGACEDSLEAAVNKCKTKLLGTGNSDTIPAADCEAKASASGGTQQCITYNDGGKEACSVGIVCETSACFPTKDASAQACLGNGGTPIGGMAIDECQKLVDGNNKCLIFTEASSCDMALQCYQSSNSCSGTEDEALKLCASNNGTNLGSIAAADCAEKAKADPTLKCYNFNGGGNCDAAIACQESTTCHKDKPTADNACTGLGGYYRGSAVPFAECQKTENNYVKCLVFSEGASCNFGLPCEFCSPNLEEAVAVCEKTNGGKFIDYMPNAQCDEKAASSPDNLKCYPFDKSSTGCNDSVLCEKQFCTSTIDEAYAVCDKNNTTPLYATDINACKEMAVNDPAMSCVPWNKSQVAGNCDAGVVCQKKSCYTTLDEATLGCSGEGGTYITAMEAAECAAQAKTNPTFKCYTFSKNGIPGTCDAAALCKLQTAGCYDSIDTATKGCYGYAGTPIEAMEASMCEEKAKADPTIKCLAFNKGAACDAALACQQASCYGTLEEANKSCLVNGGSYITYMPNAQCDEKVANDPNLKCYVFNKSGTPGECNDSVLCQQSACYGTQDEANSACVSSNGSVLDSVDSISCNEKAKGTSDLKCYGWSQGASCDMSVMCQDNPCVQDKAKADEACKAMGGVSQGAMPLAECQSQETYAFGFAGMMKMATSSQNSSTYNKCVTFTETGDPSGGACNYGMLCTLPSSCLDSKEAAYQNCISKGGKEIGSAPFAECDKKASTDPNFTCYAFNQDATCDYGMVCDLSGACSGSMEEAVKACEASGGKDVDGAMEAIRCTEMEKADPNTKCFTFNKSGTCDAAIACKSLACYGSKEEADKNCQVQGGAVLWGGPVADCEKMSTEFSNASCFAFNEAGSCDAGLVCSLPSACYGTRQEAYDTCLKNRGTIPWAGDVYGCKKLASSDPANSACYAYNESGSCDSGLVCNTTAGCYMNKEEANKNCWADGGTFDTTVPTEECKKIASSKLNSSCYSFNESGSCDMGHVCDLPASCYDSKDLAYNACIDQGGTTVYAGDSAKCNEFALKDPNYSCFAFNESGKCDAGFVCNLPNNCSDNVDVALKTCDSKGGKSVGQITTADCEAKASALSNLSCLPYMETSENVKASSRTESSVRKKSTAKSSSVCGMSVACEMPLDTGCEPDKISAQKSCEGQGGTIVGSAMATDCQNKIAGDPNLYCINFTESSSCDMSLICKLPAACLDNKAIANEYCASKNGSVKDYLKPADCEKAAEADSSLACFIFTDQAKCDIGLVCSVPQCLANKDTATVTCQEKYLGSAIAGGPVQECKEKAAADPDNILCLPYSELGQCDYGMVCKLPASCLASKEEALKTCESKGGEIVWGGGTPEECDKFASQDPNYSCFKYSNGGTCDTGLVCNIKSTCFEAQDLANNACLESGSKPGDVMKALQCKELAASDPTLTCNDFKEGPENCAFSVPCYKPASCFGSKDEAYDNCVRDGGVYKTFAGPIEECRKYEADGKKCYAFNEAGSCDAGLLCEKSACASDRQQADMACSAAGGSQDGRIIPIEECQTLSASDSSYTCFPYSEGGGTCNMGLACNVAKCQPDKASADQACQSEGGMSVGFGSLSDCLGKQMAGQKCITFTEKGDPASGSCGYAALCQTSAEPMDCGRVCCHNESKWMCPPRIDSCTADSKSIEGLFYSTDENCKCDCI